MRINMGLFPKTVDSQFLVKIIKKEASTEEKEFFEAWLSESEANKEEFGTLALLWDKGEKSPVPLPPNAKLQWEKIKERIKESETKLSVIQPSIQADSANTATAKEPFVVEDIFKRNYTAEILGWAVKIAAIVLLVAVTIIYYNKSQIQTIKYNENISQNTQPVKTLKLVTQKGERKTLPLSDGSIIYLNADSKVTYPSSFSRSERKVVLEGEAYFSINKDASRPFRIVTGGTVTEVTGTEFNIKYRNNKYNLVVTRGAVIAKNLRTPKDVLVDAGKMVSCSRTSEITRPVKVNVDDFIAWRKNKLAFRHSSLSEVMNEIETYYNVKVVFNTDSVKKKTLSGIFNTNSIDDVLSMISLSMDVQIKREGKKIIVN